MTMVWQKQQEGVVIMEIATTDHRSAKKNTAETSSRRPGGFIHSDLCFYRYFFNEIAVGTLFLSAMQR